MFGELFDKRAGVDPDDGLAALAAADDDAQAEIDAVLAEGPDLYMVDSDRGITNLHVPERRDHRRLDAGADPLQRPGLGRRRRASSDTKCVIPDSSYAALYQETIDHCREHGAFDPATMGTTPNVGLMAQKAEEYGSHDKTFEIEAPGTVRVVNRRGRDAARARGRRGRHLAHVPDQGRPDPGLGAAGGLARARDRRARRLLARRDARPRRRAAEEGAPGARGARHRRRCRSRSCRWPRPPRFTLERARRGEDTISVTGNVLRDYLTDLFPILELGTSAKMLSIVPLMERRRPVRDRRRRLGAQARASSSWRRTTCAGTRSASSSRSPPRSSSSPTRRTTRAPGCSARRSTARPAGCSRRAARRRARPASSTTAAATPTWRSTGRPSWPRRPTTPSWRPRFAPLAERLAADEEQIVEELNGGPGRARRHRRLLPPGRRRGRRRDAPERDAQRGARRRLRRIAANADPTGEPTFP